MKLIFNILLALLGFGAIILEFFVPAAGVIGLIGAGFVVAGIVYTYITYGLIGGTIFLISCAIVGPIIIYGYFKLFPTSYIGRKLILDRENRTDESIDKTLLGASGITKTTLRPSGFIEIGEKRYNATTNGGFIDKGLDIVVKKIEGNKIVVSLKELV